MNSENIKLDRKSELIKLITHYNQAYWVEGESLISDSEYDLLFQELATLDPSNPLLHQVYAPDVATLGKVQHREPMLSLDKAYSLAEIISWASKHVRNSDELLLVEPKYDGISGYFDGNILATRGDGEIGENISDKLPLIELEAPNYRGAVNREVRGEIIIRKDDFATIYSHIRKKGGGTYKNSRNAVAGIMSLKDISSMQHQGARLTLVDYDLISKKVTFENLASRWDELLLEMESLPYPLDGIVVKFADKEYAASLGNTAHHPRGQIAFKFSNIRRESRLLDVEWSFGKSSLTPVAIIEPVDIGGTTIRRASLHNVQNIIDLDLEIGDDVVVERAGDVIPHIVSSTAGAKRRSPLITHCPNPECNALLERKGPELCCTNPECSETLLRNLTASVKSIGIENLGEPNIRRMMAVLGVKSLHDIFRLKRGDILKLEGFAERSADNLLGEIATAKRVNDYQLLASLNVPHVGANVAKSILQKHSFEEIRKMSETEFIAIDGIGPERASALWRELAAQGEFLDQLLEEIELVHSTGESQLSTICFTGKMPEKRSFYEKLAQERNLQPVDSVSSSLTILVAMSIDNGSSKIKKAQKLGVKIMTLDQWLHQPTTDMSSPKAELELEPEAQMTFGF